MMHQKCVDKVSAIIKCMVACIMQICKWLICACILLWNNHTSNWWVILVIHWFAPTLLLHRSKHQSTFWFVSILPFATNHHGEESSIDLTASTTLIDMHTIPTIKQALCAWAWSFDNLKFRIVHSNKQLALYLKAVFAICTQHCT